MASCWRNSRCCCASVRVIALTAVAVFCPVAVYAQSSNASLTGRITDPSKAVIPAAKVSVINTGTRIHYDTATNGTGSYYVANLSPRTYRVEVEKLGFKTVIKSDLVLHVQDAVEVNFEMASDPRRRASLSGEARRC